LTVLVAALALAGVCELARREVRRDLLPELAGPRVLVVADWMGHPAAAVATGVTRVLTGGLETVRGVSAVRGSTMDGMASVEVLLDSSADDSRASGEVVAAIARLEPSLPAGVRLQVSTGVSSTGWVFQYVLVDPTHGQTLRTLKDLQDRLLAPALQAVPGVAEVASLGGVRDQVVIDVRSEALAARGLAFSDVVEMLRPGLAETAGTLAAVAELPLDSPGREGARSRLRDVAQVRLGPEMQSGMGEFEGTRVVVGGIVAMARGADVPSVVSRVKGTLARLAPGLPANVQVLTVYDRSEVVDGMQRSLLRTLGEEIAVVALVLLLFLLHPRSTVVPLVTLPLVVLLTFGGMWLLGVPATLMSLGGIAIALGLAVDADVVALDACHRRMEERALSAQSRRGELVSAADTFGQAVLTSLLISALAFLPVLAFAGETGRLLRPLAVGKTLVIAATALVALTVGPALRDRLLRGEVRPERLHPVMPRLEALYRPFVQLALARPLLTLGVAGLAVLSCLPIALRLGGEFLPRIDEGDLLFMPTTLPGAPPHELPSQLQRMDQALRDAPEVARVFGKIGRAETGTDPAPLSMAEINIRLRPSAEWPRGPRQRWYSGWTPPGLRALLRRWWPEDAPASRVELLERLDRRARLPGWSSAWTAPARARLDMATTGLRTPVGLRVVGADPARVSELALQAREIVLRVGGTRSAALDSLQGEGGVGFEVDRSSAARFSVAPSAIEETVSLLGSDGQLGIVSLDGTPTRVQLVQDLNARSSADQLRMLTVRSTGARSQPVPLALLGRPVQRVVPASVKTEGKELVEYVAIDLDPEVDLLGYVQRGQEEVRRAEGRGELSLRPGERLDWIGQYPLLVAGERRLRWIAPLVLVSMLVLLYLQFRSLAEALIVLASVPFALVGSVWTVHWLGYALSPPVWVGMLAVTGLAMQTGVVMVVYIDEALRRRAELGRLRTPQDVIEAHAEGTVRRLRPKLMTVATMAAGLLPLLWTDGAGVEIMRRVAAPMIGGLVTSAFLTLEVLPVLYTLWRVRQLRRAQRLGVDPARLMFAPAGYNLTSAATDGTPLVSTRKSM
jgi:Cu(I)/Ag(I) efflux system membrane protein CusA/SilA